MILKGKTAIVTGSTSGIGLGLVRGLAEAGADVVLNSFTDTPQDHAMADAIAAEFKVSARYVSADMRDGDACRQLIGDVGRCDILVNNAGHNITENFEDISEESFDRMISVHQKGTFFMTQAVYKDMKTRGDGRIINVTSQLAYKGAPTLTHYCAAKGANATFTRALALECAGTGILVNAVAPGVTNTDLLTPLADELLNTLKSAIPLNRFADVDEIAPAVAFLAGPEGSFFHGTCISPNGGEVML